MHIFRAFSKRKIEKKSKVSFASFDTSQFRFPQPCQRFSPVSKNQILTCDKKTLFIAGTSRGRDDDSTRNPVKMALEMDGHTVDSVADGIAVIRTMEGSAGGYDLLLLDIMLPGATVMRCSGR